MRFAYADPPYLGQAKRLYGAHPDYAGEVDHGALVAQLSTFDAWALSCSVKSLPAVLRLCPEDVLVLSWIKPIAPPMGDHRHYSWEPVILHGGRHRWLPTKMHCIASPPQFTFRARPEGHVIGEKPEAFSLWLFACAGLYPDDEMHDLFPGSGAVTRAWAKFCEQPGLAFAVERACSHCAHEALDVPLRIAGGEVEHGD